jgi:hypothetical protein
MPERRRWRKPKQQENYGNYGYEEFTRINDWLLSHDAARSYCVNSIRLSYLCPIAEVSSVRFLGFLLTHIDRNTLPYLSGYLLGLAILAGMIVMYTGVASCGHSGRRSGRSSARSRGV